MCIYVIERINRACYITTGMGRAVSRITEKEIIIRSRCAADSTCSKAESQTPHVSNLISIRLECSSHRLRVGAFFSFYAGLLRGLLFEIFEGVCGEPWFAREVQQPYFLTSPKNQVIFVGNPIAPANASMCVSNYRSQCQRCPWNEYRGITPETCPVGKNLGKECSTPRLPTLDHDVARTRVHV